VTVFLVGAGPGDPGLLTVRGRDLLSEANVVLYDALVDPRLLGLTRPGCTLVDVGKTTAEVRGPRSEVRSPKACPQPDQGADPAAMGAAVARGLVPRQGSPTGPHAAATREHATSQDTINSLLVAYGRQFECVVRLKGGDPFIFGRGGEEALALVDAGIPFDVVPGVSSAIAAPAYAGIPVTHRGLASSVTIVTGHEAPDKGQGAAAVDWARLATATDTLVILMGVGKLPAIAAQLIDHGRAPETPAAVIEQGTTPYQRVVSGSLSDLPALAAAAGIRSPAAIVVGEVVRLREALAWFAPLSESDSHRHSERSEENAPMASVSAG